MWPAPLITAVSCPRQPLADTWEIVVVARPVKRCLSGLNPRFPKISISGGILMNSSNGKQIEGLWSLILGEVNKSLELGVLSLTFQTGS